MSGPHEGALDVAGGAGGTAADLDAMAGAGGELTACAAGLAHAGGRLLTVQTDDALLATALLDPRGAADVQRRLVGVAVGGGGLPALAGKAALLGAAVRASALAYQSSDAALARVLVGVRDGVAGAAGSSLWRAAWQFPAAFWPVAGAVATGVALWRTGDLAVVAVDDALDDARAGDLELDDLDERYALLAVAVAGRGLDDGEAVLGWMAEHPAVAEHVVGAAPSFLSGVAGLRTAAAHERFGHDGSMAAAGPWSFPPEDVDDLAMVLAVGGLATGQLPGGPVRVRPPRVHVPPPPHPPGGVGDLVQRAVALAPRSSDGFLVGEPGRVRVERVSRGGSTATVVYAPGTQTWAAGSANPMDVTTNVHAMAGLDTAAESAVVQALRAEGVGRDEPLLLVGYSQGGLTSAALAADPAFRAEFRPVAVLTAGAPVAGAGVPDDVPVLSLEHAEDLVTVVDGAPNPDGASWTTVRRHVLDADTGDAGVLADIDQDPLSPHQGAVYERTAALVDASEHPSVLAWLGAAAPFLGGPGATSSAGDWVAERDVGGSGDRAAEGP